MPSRESLRHQERIEIAGVSAVGDAVASARRYARDHRLGRRGEARLCIIVEELVTNMLEHGGNGTERPIAIEFARQGGTVSIVIEDCGPPFDLGGAGDGDIPARGGGAGLRLVRAWSKIVDYRLAGGKNRLELSVALTRD